MELHLYLVLVLLLNFWCAAGWDSFDGRQNVWGTTVPEKPQPTPGPNSCIDIKHTTPQNFRPNEIADSGRNPFRGVKFEQCKASFPQDSLIQDSKCKLKSGEKSRFCPTTRFWYWGQPQPLKSGHVCGKHQACDISQQQTKAFSDTTTNGRTTEVGSTTTFTLGLNLGFEMPIGAGPVPGGGGVPGDPGTAAAAGAARLKPRQGKKGSVGLTFSVAKAFSQSFGRSTARTAGYTDSTGTIASIHRPSDSMEKCGTFYVVPQYQGVCGVMASDESEYDQYFTCGNHIVNGTSTEDPMKTGHAYHTVWVVLDCDDQQEWGPELQDPRYKQAIIWSDWAHWLMYRSRDSDQTITLEGTNPHTGDWFGFEHPTHLATNDYPAPRGKTINRTKQNGPGPAAGSWEVIGLILLTGGAAMIERAFSSVQDTSNGATAAGGGSIGGGTGDGATAAIRGGIGSHLGIGGGRDYLAIAMALAIATAVALAVDAAVVSHVDVCVGQ